MSKPGEDSNRTNDDDDERDKKRHEKNRLFFSFNDYKRENE